jgi:hypothetical protein
MSKLIEKCIYCKKEFSNKKNLLQHQKTVKSCIKLQEKDESSIIEPTHMECLNCNKVLTIRSYKKHKINCDIKYNINIEPEKEYKEVYIKNGELEMENKILNKKISDLTEELKECRESIFKLNIELVEHKSYNVVLREQNEKIQSISTGVTMKLAERATTTTNTNNSNKFIINIPLTNEVLRKCANTFTLDNACNINGITKHLTSSLENHVKCTDPSRNIFKYFNEKEEEIVDKDLENLLPQYLTAVKDRNNFLYKEVYEYFKKNKVALNDQTDYQIFYQALNNIIEKTGQKDKYTEKYKQYMVNECKRIFLEKNKNKDKAITKKLSEEEMMTNIIETGGTINDFLNKFFPEYNTDEETDEQYEYRRKMEDLFREKKKEWKNSKEI